MGAAFGAPLEATFGANFEVSSMLTPARPGKIHFPKTSNPRPYASQLIYIKNSLKTPPCQEHRPQAKPLKIPL